MASGPESILVIGPFPFRIEPGEAEGYRLAAGMPGSGVLHCMATRALSSDAVLPALKELLADRTAVHHTQDMAVNLPLRAGVDYACEVRISQTGETALRLEQLLRDGSGRVCLTLTSVIGLVSP